MKKFISSLLIAAGLMLAIPSQAQLVKFGVKGGSNLSKPTYQISSSTTTGKQHSGFFFGLILFDLMIKMFIEIFALNIGGWLDLVKDAMEQLHNSFSGGENLYAVLDAKLDAVIKLNAKLYENAEIWDGSIFQSLIGIILNLI